MVTGRLLQQGAFSAAQNMAIDEALLRQVQGPVLRFYGWNEPVVSLGFFQPCSVAPPGVAVIRRPTGGGLVDHRSGQTYTLVVPLSHPWGKWPLEESYRAIHEAIVHALGAGGARVSLASGCEPPNTACFARAVKFDVLAEDGRKIAGAAQRRTRQGWLHQGCVHTSDAHWTRRLTQVLALAMDTEWMDSELLPSELELAQELERVKYRQASWNQDGDA